MSRVVKAVQGDTVDTICRAAFGGESGYVEPVLAANPGI